MVVAVVAVATAAVTVTLAAEEAEVTTGDELSEQMPLLTDPVTVEEASAIGGEDEDMREDAIAVGIGGDRGIPMTLPPVLIPALLSLVGRSVK